MLVVAGLIPGRINCKRTWSKSWLHDRQLCVASRFCLCRLFFRDLSLGPVDVVPFHGHGHRRQRIDAQMGAGCMYGLKNPFPAPGADNVRS